ncbi:hypothetical protein ACIRD6_24015 [Streptomyces sp. NPDC102473]|uniref:hypothetical protein n=1 Tax=unclassified Streptomyces TaxID=2593676 RepID=UPI0038016714
MRKIILMMSVSLDGFVEGPGRQLDRRLVDEEPHRHVNQRTKTISASSTGGSPMS